MRRTSQGLWVHWLVAALEAFAGQLAPCVSRQKQALTLSERRQNVKKIGAALALMASAAAPTVALVSCNGMLVGAAGALGSR